MAFVERHPVERHDAHRVFGYGASVKRGEASSPDRARHEPERSTFLVNAEVEGERHERDGEGRTDGPEQRGDHSIEASRRDESPASGSGETEGTGSHSRNEPEGTRGCTYTRQCWSRPAVEDREGHDVCVYAHREAMAGVSNQNGTRRSEERL